MASEAIEAAKQRVALAEKWEGSAKQMLESARSEVKAAKDNLKSLESKFEVIELEDSDDEANDKTNDGSHVGADVSSSQMQIFVRMEYLRPFRTITLTVNPSMKIGEVKAMVHSKEGISCIPPSVQRLQRMHGPDLKDDHTLEYYDVRVVIVRSISSHSFVSVLLIF